MTRMLEAALRNRMWVVLGVMLVAAAGVFSMAGIPLDAVPDITNVQVMVNTKTAALDPEQIEKTITYAIETELAGMPGLREVRSLSKYGLSQIIVVFEDGTDIYRARQITAERLGNLSGKLPRGIVPELAPVTTGLGEVLMYVVLARPGSELSRQAEAQRLTYLRTIQDYVIRPRLKRTAGVADVDSSGGYRKEIHVNVDPFRMEAYGVSLQKVEDALRSVGDNYGGGYIETGGRHVIVRSAANVDSLDQIRRLPIKLNVWGSPILVTQVADVRADHSQRLGAAAFNGKETVLGTVLMRMGSNSRSVTLDSIRALGDVQLPADVVVQTVYARSYLVNAVIRTVALNLAEGAALVVVVLLLILGNWRAALIVSLAIPLSMLFALVGMRFLNLSANLMSLGAVDFGLLVDASVVIVENTLRRMDDEEGTPDSARRLAIIREAARETVAPVVTGLVIIMAVYLPILALEGTEGKLFRPMAWTVLLALSASLVVGVLVMPVFVYLLLRGKPSESHPFLYRVVARAYETVLRFAIWRTWAFPAGALAITLVGAFLFARMGSEFVPTLDEGDLVIGLVRNADTSLQESLRRQKLSEAAILTFPETEFVFSRTGTPESATDPMGVNFTDTFVILKKDQSAWSRNADGSRRSKADLFLAMKKRIESAVPGQEVSPTQPIEMRFNEMLEGSRADVTLRIFGPDLKQLLTYVERAETELKAMQGVDVEMDPLTALRASPILDVRPNAHALARYGITLETVNHTVEGFMSGRKVGSFYEGDRRFPIVMHLDESLRNRPDVIGRLPISLPDGGSVALRQVARVSEQNHVTTIARMWANRYAAVSIYLRGRDLDRSVREAQQRLAERLTLAPGYTLEWAGQFRNLQAARARLAVIVPLTLGFVFLLLLRNFRDWRLALLVFSTVPFAASGGVFALALRGIPFSVSAAVGFIALSGIAILNTTVLVTFVRDLRASGLDPVKAALTGAQVRLRPVLMTAMVAGFGFVPMMLNTGLGAEVQRPLATVVVGGLITATLLTLLVIPVAYVLLERGHRQPRIVPP